MRLAGLVCAALVLSAAAFAANDPSGLVQKARKAHASRDNDKAIALLRKADAAWQETTPNAPEHAEALELMALLMKDQAALKVQASGPQPYATDFYLWTMAATPVVKRALDICEANSNIKPEDLALALELQADLLGRKEEGAPFWDRATKIRADRIAAAYAAPQVLVAASGINAPDRISGDVSQPEVLTKREPEYTENARLMRYNGVAQFSVIINNQGIPIRIRLVRGLGYGLDENAAEAISTWRFRPATKNGAPVAVMANIAVSFRLL